MRRGGDPRYMELRLALFFAAAAFFLAAVVTRREGLALPAVAALALALGLRFVPRGGEEEAAPEQGEDAGEGGGAG